MRRVDSGTRRLDDARARLRRSAVPRLLYITPYFPPLAHVGALRPLKFVRHLGAHGWDVTVLADLTSSQSVERRLWDAVPASVDVRWDYSGRAQPAFDAAMQAPSVSTATAAPRAKRGGLRAPAWLKWSPEYVPLGEHSVEIPRALRAGRRLLREQRFDAIMVNADPYAALLVGLKLGREFDTPLLADLRDPWALCDLRRPERPAPQRALTDALERRVVEGAARFIVNSRTTYEAYRTWYDDVPDDRLAWIRNHGDAGLIGGAPAPRDEDAPFTLLFLGSFRRYLHGNAMLEALAALRQRGVGPGDVRLVVTGSVTAEARAIAEELGVSEPLVEQPYVPYPDIGGAMAAADLLLCLNNASTMRLPSKLYDYAMSERPILVMADPAHDELVEMTGALAGASFRDLRDAAGIADVIEAELGRGRRRVVARTDTGLDSATATARLVSLLDQVTR